MAKMKQYTNYCTPEQTKRAYKLGAPILEYFEEGTHYPQCELPTTQQMLNWLREKGCIFNLYYCYFGYDYQVEFGLESTDKHTYSINYEQAELASIDAALDYLEKGE